MSFMSSCYSCLLPKFAILVPGEKHKKKKKRTIGNNSIVGD